jgi:hypothetical protein
MDARSAALAVGCVTVAGPTDARQVRAPKVVQVSCYEAVADRLHGNGQVRLRIRVRGNGIRDSMPVRIVLSECNTDPPLYPDPGCEVKP